jgi:hypothetical protein
VEGRTKKDGSAELADVDNVVDGEVSVVGFETPLA